MLLFLISIFFFCFCSKVVLLLDPLTGGQMEEIEKGVLERRGRIVRRRWDYGERRVDLLP